MPLVASRANASAKAFGFSAALAGEELGGMVLMTPSSIASTGTGNSSSIGANGSVTFSSCETLSLNGVFTSEYDNYMIVMRFVHTSGDYSSAIRFRSAGFDATASNYSWQNLEASSSSVSGQRFTSQAYWGAFDASNDQRDGCVFNLYGPFLSQPTAYKTVSAQGFLNGRIFDNAGTHSLSSSYDGLTFYPIVGAFTGLVSVYGLGG